jgi:urease accessory protein
MAGFHGQLSLGAEARDGRTVLAAQAFRAPFHVSKPYWDADTETLLVQVVNPTAGILAGDRLESDITVGAGAALLVTTPSASRVFQMQGGSADCRQHFTVERGGWLEVLPEPLVPHRGCRYHQCTRMDVAPGGSLFFADLLQPGRVAHGEAWEWDRLCLEVEVHSGAALVLRERFAPTGEELKAMAKLIRSGPAACFGNAVLLAGETPAEAGWRDEVHAMQCDGLWIGVSRLRADGWSLKFVAADGVRLRAALKDIRRILSAHFRHLACDARKL